MAVIDYFQQIIDGFLNPQKRLFVGYLLSSLVIAALWLMFVKGRSISRTLKHIFSRSVWWSASAKLDYQLVFANRLVMLLLSPVLLTQLVVASAVFYGLYEWLPQRPVVLQSWPDWSVGLLFTVVYFVVDDFARFYVHLLLHRIPVLWAFHKLHHNAETLTPITVLRSHPVESIIFSLRSTLVQALMIATAVFFLGDRIDLLTILGASIIVFAFNVFGSNLRHSHIAIAYPKWLERILFSPAQHQIHHSNAQQHLDKNFGVALSVWDRLWGTFHYSEPQQQLRFGLYNELSSPHTLYHAYCQPFVDCWRICQSALSRYGLANRSVQKIHSVLREKLL